MDVSEIIRCEGNLDFRGQERARYEPESIGRGQ